MTLSPHFHLEEFTVSRDAVKFGISNEPDEDARRNLLRLAQMLEVVRNELGGNALIITSGYRSKKLNAMVGGAPNSAHSNGMAADFICPGFGSPLKICQAIISAGIDFDQMILEPGWVHFSIADKPRRQILTARPGSRYAKGLRLTETGNHA